MSKKGVPLGALSPKVAEGITQGKFALEEANEKFPILPGALDLSYLLKRDGVGVRFRASLAENQQVALRFPDGRMFADTDIAMTARDRNRIEMGYVCLRCLEPQRSANADEHLPGCIGVDHYGSRYMRDGHMMVDVAAEFHGNKHVGPSRPIRQYAEEQDQRKEKIEWMRQRADRGASVEPEMIEEVWPGATTNASR